MHTYKEGSSTVTVARVLGLSSGADLGGRDGGLALVDGFTAVIGHRRHRHVQQRRARGTWKIGMGYIKPGAQLKF